MTDFLELEESELFDVQGDTDVPLAKSLQKISTPDRDAPGACSDDDESTGLVLDFDELGGTTTSTDRTVPTPNLVEEVAPQVASELGSSIGNTSEVGSLKRFDSLGSAGGRPFGSEGDLGLGASMPIRMGGLTMPQRSVTPGVDPGAGAYLGTSMPIRIPMMQRRSTDASPSSIEGRAATFVPPHLLDVHSKPSIRGASSLALSPSAAVKREKLIARNAILRSTGFIETRSFAPVGEVIDAVKESILPSVEVGLPKRHRATSSLTAALGPSSLKD